MEHQQSHYIVQGTSIQSKIVLPTQAIPLEDVSPVFCMVMRNRQVRTLRISVITTADCGQKMIWSSQCTHEADTEDERCILDHQNHQTYHLQYLNWQTPTCIAFLNASSHYHRLKTHLNRWKHTSHRLLIHTAAWVANHMLS